MKILLAVIVSWIFTPFITNAQQSLCLVSGASPGTIEFKADEFNSFLHPERYKAILFGELHNGSFNPEIAYHLITHLNQACDIRHVFMEMGASCAWRFNRFLVHGDTSYLSHRGLVAYYGEWPKFWKRLYEYNKRLPKGEKIVFHGLDFERVDVFEAILMQVDLGRTVPQSLKAVMDTVRAHSIDPPFVISCCLVKAP